MGKVLEMLVGSERAPGAADRHRSHGFCPYNCPYKPVAVRRRLRTVVGGSLSTTPYNLGLFAA